MIPAKALRSQALQTMSLTECTIAISLPNINHAYNHFFGGWRNTTKISDPQKI